MLPLADLPLFLPCQVLHMFVIHPRIGCVDINEEASWGESRWYHVALRGAHPPHGAPGRVSRKSDGRQPCGRRDACVENRCSVVSRSLTSLSVGMLVCKCWLCESARAAVTNTTGWVAETAAFFFFFRLKLLLLGQAQQACCGWVSVLSLETAETRCLHPPPTCFSGTCRVADI